MILDYAALSKASDATLKEVKRRYAEAPEGTMQKEAHKIAESLLLERQGISQQIFLPANQRWRPVKS